MRWRSALAVGTVALLSLAFMVTAGPTGAATGGATRVITATHHIGGIVLVRTKLHTRIGTVTPNGTPPLLYHGGKVMRTTSKTYAIYWKPPTLQNGNPTHMSSGYSRIVNQYFKDVGGNGLYDVNTEYYQTNSSHPIVNSSSFAGSYVDHAPYPASGCTDPLTPGNCLTDAQLQNEVTKVMGIKGWTASNTKEFFVFTSYGEGSCFDSTGGICAFTYYCAYHGDFSSNGKSVIYSNMPYVGTYLQYCSTLTSNAGSPNGNVDADSVINVTSHEQMESVTDPHLNAWYDSSGYENGDECAWLFPSPLPLDGGKATVQWNTRFYYAQSEWSNNANDCLFST